MKITKEVLEEAKRIHAGARERPLEMIHAYIKFNNEFAEAAVVEIERLRAMVVELNSILDYHVPPPKGCERNDDD